MQKSPWAVSTVPDLAKYPSGRANIPRGKGENWRTEKKPMCKKRNGWDHVIGGVHVTSRVTNPWKRSIKGPGSLLDEDVKARLTETRPTLHLAREALPVQRVLALNVPKYLSTAGGKSRIKQGRLKAGYKADIFLKMAKNDRGGGVKKEKNGDLPR